MNKIVHYDIKSLHRWPATPACGISPLSLGSSRCQVTTLPKKKNFWKDDFWCEKCVNSQAFQDDLYLLEIGCDGNEKAFNDIKIEREKK